MDVHSLLLSVCVVTSNPNFDPPRTAAAIDGSVRPQCPFMTEASSDQSEHELTRFQGLRWGLYAELSGRYLQHIFD